MEKRKQATQKSKFIIYALVVALLLAAVTAWALLSDENESFSNTLGKFGESSDIEPGLTVTFVDVGQGDCVYLECGGMKMLVDGGEKYCEKTVSEFLYSRSVRSLDYVVATHPHSDHIGSLPYIIDNFDVKNAVMPMIPYELIPTNTSYEKLLSSVTDSGADVIRAKAGESFTLGDASVEIIGPVSDTADELNDMSAVLLVRYGEVSFLLTGDAETPEENSILESGADVKCTVLKAGHHGSSYSSGEAFLAAASPEYFVISCGEDNDYGHPAESTLKKFEAYSDKIYRTDKLGSITFRTDGESVTVTAGK